MSELQCGNWDLQELLQNFGFLAVAAQAGVCAPLTPFLYLRQRPPACQYVVAGATVAQRSNMTTAIVTLAQESGHMTDVVRCLQELKCDIDRQFKQLEATRSHKLEEELDFALSALNHLGRTSIGAPLLLTGRPQDAMESPRTPPMSPRSPPLSARPLKSLRTVGNDTPAVDADWES